MQTASLARGSDITPRDLDFNLDPARITDWLDGSPEKTVFLNAQSALFPVGERFFIHAVAQYRDRITEPGLKADVKAFVKQEAYHTREHVAYNEAMRTLTPPEDLERDIEAILGWVKAKLPKLASLMATCALEHYTSFLAKDVLEHPEHLQGAEPGYARLWRWHALEEIEHKAVAYDVFRSVTGGKREWRRVVAMPITRALFWYALIRVIYKLMKAQGLHRSARSWAKVAWHVFGYPGAGRRFALPFLRYLSPSFHPSDSDDRSTIEATRRLIASWNA